MRIHQWLIPAMLSLLPLTLTNQLKAQDPYQTVGNQLLDQGGIAMPYQDYGQGMPNQPFPIPDSSGQSIPPYSQVSWAPEEQAPFQPGMNPWPQISPFEYAWSQHRVDDGLWVHETRNHEIKYHFDISAMLATIRPPERTRIGDEDIDPSQHFLLIPEIWPVTDTRNVYDSKMTGGIQFKWGFDQEDDQGVEVNAFYLPYTSQTKHLGTRNGDPDNTADIDLFAPGILVNTDETWFSGFTPGERELRFDISQDYTYSHHAWGANTDWFMSPIYKRGNIRIRPLLGARYVGVKERFKFEGIDSGDLYGIVATTSTTSSGGGGTGTGTGTDTGSGTGTGTSTTRTAYVDGIIFDGPTQFSTLSSATETHLFGPEIGIDYVLGGKKFQINGSSRFGLMANKEKMRLRGKGFGGVFSFREIDFGDDDDDTDTDTDIAGEVLFDFDYDPDRVFSTTKSHMHVSPMFIQDFNMEVAILDLIPFIRKSSYFDKAVLKVGYSFLIATEIARPESIIVWNDQPIDPQINSKNRTNWWIQSLNLGIEWRY